ncbi:hypothetical protein BS78_05G243900 [Paspalum vaginatum]|nr:hypothetical protein BS78_05G243900 [Paspalum vaginatum]
MVKRRMNEVSRPDERQLVQTQPRSSIGKVQRSPASPAMMHSRRLGHADDHEGRPSRRKKASATYRRYRPARPPWLSELPRLRTWASSLGACRRRWLQRDDLDGVAAEEHNAGILSVAGVRRADRRVSAPPRRSGRCASAMGLCRRSGAGVLCNLSLFIRVLSTLARPQPLLLLSLAAAYALFLCKTGLVE